MAVLQRRERVEESLTFGKVVIIDSDVLSRQVCGDLMLPPSLCFQLEIVLAGHAAWLVAGVHHMAPAFNFGRICVLQTHRVNSASVHQVSAIPSVFCSTETIAGETAAISQEKLLGHFVQTWKSQRCCTCCIPWMQMALLAGRQAGRVGPAAH